MSKTDIQLQRDVEDELHWDPKVSAVQIAVSVERGAVLLVGTVNTYAEKWAAENAAKRVHGVRTVEQELTVKLVVDHLRRDSDIAEAAQSALLWDVFVPKTVVAKVHRGAVTLEGQVAWNFQREAAERAIRHLTGIVAVYNSITLKPEISAAQVKEKVAAALRRQATLDAKSIQVDTTGGRVTLTGQASSWQSIEDAANAAWAVPGVTEVIDRVKTSMRF